MDEAEKGRRVRRDGLERATAICRVAPPRHCSCSKFPASCVRAIEASSSSTSKLSRKGLRAISTSQGIDTRDEKTWKALMYLHGMMDEMLLDTIADHCRAGLKSLFEQGYVTGALTVGYQRIEVPDAPLTNRKLPRTMPQVIEEVAALIRQHFQWIRDGMTIKEGWRRWLAAGGPYDPAPVTSACRTPRIAACSLTPGTWGPGRLVVNETVGLRAWTTTSRLTALWRKWLFIAARICGSWTTNSSSRCRPGWPSSSSARAARTSKRRRFISGIWLRTSSIAPPASALLAGRDARQGHVVQSGDLCPCKSAVNRQDAVEAICKKLIELIRQDADLFLQIICGSQKSTPVATSRCRRRSPR